MSKEIINPKSIRANNPDWQEGYDQGLLAGYAKSIVLIRHLERTLSPNKSLSPSAWEDTKVHQREILEEAMKLISKNIEADNE